MANVSTFEVDITDWNQAAIGVLDKIDLIEKRIKELNEIPLRFNTSAFHISADKVINKLNKIDGLIGDISKKQLKINFTSTNGVAKASVGSSAPREEKKASAEDAMTALFKREHDERQKSYNAMAANLRHEETLEREKKRQEEALMAEKKKQESALLKQKKLDDAAKAKEEKMRLALQMKTQKDEEKAEKKLSDSVSRYEAYEKSRKAIEKSAIDSAMSERQREAQVAYKQREEDIIAAFEDHDRQQSERRKSQWETFMRGAQPKESAMSAGLARISEMNAPAQPTRSIVAERAERPEVRPTIQRTNDGGIAMPNIMRGIGGVAMSAIKGIGGMLISAFTGISGLVWKGVKGLIGGIVKSITWTLGKVWDGLKGTLGLVWGGIKKLMVGIPAAIGAIYGASGVISDRFREASAMSKVNAGDLPRLQATFGRIVDVNKMMGAIAQQQYAPYSYPLAAMGLTPKQSREMGTEKQMVESLKYARGLGKKFGASEITQTTYGLDELGMSVEDLIRVTNMSEESFQDLIKTSEKAANALKYSSPEAWSKFKMKADIGLSHVFAMLTNSVTPLLRPLDKLFDAMSSSLEKHGGPDFMGRIVDSLVSGIERLTQAFEKDDWNALFKEMSDKLASAAVSAMDAMWEVFNKRFPEAASTLTGIVTEIKSFLPTWNEIKSAISQSLPTWKEIPDILRNTVDAFYGFLEAVDKLLWKVTHMGDDIGYEPSEWAKPMAGTAARMRWEENQEIEKNRRDMMLREQGEIDARSGLQPTRFERGVNRLAQMEVGFNESLWSGVKKVWEGATGSEDYKSRGKARVDEHKYDPLFEKYGKQYNIDPVLLRAQAKQESGFREDIITGKVRSSAGAMGMTQFMPGTWEKYGKGSPFDPENSVEAQAKYMRKLLDQFGGREDLALAAYNAGENRQSLREGRIPEIAQTQDYVSKISADVKKTREAAMRDVPKERMNPNPQPVPQQDSANFWQQRMSNGVNVTIRSDQASNVMTQTTSLYGSSP